MLVIYKSLQNAGSHAFSIGITEVLNTNLLIELNADDIEYVYQRSVMLFGIGALSLWFYLA